MEITERQGKILTTIVREYINSAEPVASQLLEKKYDFGICPATIRIEMQKLTDKGFLEQPHTSAGRVPTDRGYRFFVDELLQSESKNFKINDLLEKEIGDTIKFIQSLTKNLALSSHALVMSYLKDEDIFWKEGWEEILREPEFREEDFAINFTELLENFEKNIGDFKIDSGIKIYIGRENPFPRAGDFSIIASECFLPDRKKGIVSLFGPKRMAYDRNIGLMNTLTKLLEKL